MSYLSDEQIYELRSTRTTIADNPRFAYADAAMDVRDLYEAHLKEKDELLREAAGALEAVQHIFLCEDEGMASGQPTKEDYLQARELVAAALALVNERSKPSILVGFSEEGIDPRMIADEIAEDNGVDDETTEGAWAWRCMLEAAKAVHAAHIANTRAVSIDQIMDKVASWESTWAMDPPAETPEALRGMWNDLRQRLENIKP